MHRVIRKDLTLEKIEEGRRRRGRQNEMVCITDSTDMSLSKLWEIVKEREACCAAACGVAKSWIQLSD